MLVNWDRLLIVLVGGTAKHCVDKYVVLFRCCSLGGYTDMPGGLHVRLYCALLVISFVFVVPCSGLCWLLPAFECMV